jgi:hypothetical protein
MAELYQFLKRKLIWNIEKVLKDFLVFLN